MNSLKLILNTYTDACFLDKVERNETQTSLKLQREIKNGISPNTTTCELKKIF